jgi:hypothetical protein
MPLLPPPPPPPLVVVSTGAAQAWHSKCSQSASSARRRRGPGPRDDDDGDDDGVGVDAAAVPRCSTSKRMRKACSPRCPRAQHCVHTTVAKERMKRISG